MTTTFTPGAAVGICGPQVQLIAGITLEDPRLPQLWQAVSASGADAVDNLLRILFDGGFDAMPAFALVAAAGQSARVVVRHPAVVSATVDGEPVELTSTVGGTWSDVTLEGVSAVVLRSEPGVATTVQLPFHAGMTPASAISVELEATDPSDAGTAGVVDSPLSTVDAPASTGDASRTAVWKAQEPAEETAAEPSEPAPAPAPPAEPDAAPSDPAPAPAAPKSGGLIDGVPWMTANWAPSNETVLRPTPVYETPSRPTPPPVPTHAVASPVPAPSAVAGDDGDDNPTVLRSELVKDLAAQVPAPGSAGIVGPSVLAVDCPNGHQTSVHEPTCRLCKAPVADNQEPRLIPRPALGALVLAGGDRLVLDKDAVLGRAPYEPEGSTDRPHLVRVGESGDISRQHAKVTLDGWHVIVRDLGTANGTTLTLPGGTPQQLRAHEDYQLEDGAEIGIADVVTLRYEVQP